MMLLRLSDRSATVGKFPVECLKGLGNKGKLLGRVVSMAAALWYKYAPALGSEALAAQWLRLII